MGVDEAFQGQVPKSKQLPAKLRAVIFCELCYYGKLSSSSKAWQKDDGRSARLESLLEHLDKLLKKTFRKL
jgi:hypothetical protein